MDNEVINATGTILLKVENLISKIILSTFLQAEKAYSDEEKQTTNNDYPEHVREMIEVFESREEMEGEPVPRKLMAPIETVCLTPSEYHGLISAVILLMILLLSIALVSGLAYRRYWATMMKNRSLDRSSVNSFIPSALHQNLNISNNQFNSSQSRGTSSSQNALRPSLNLFNGGLQKTFATGYACIIYKKNICTAN